MEKSFSRKVGSVMPLFDGVSVERHRLSRGVCEDQARKREQCLRRGTAESEHGSCTKPFFGGSWERVWERSLIGLITQNPQVLKVVDNMAQIAWKVFSAEDVRNLRCCLVDALGLVVAESLILLCVVVDISWKGWAHCGTTLMFRFPSGVAMDVLSGLFILFISRASSLRSIRLRPQWKIP